MKKYIKPSVTIVEIETEHIMAASPEGYSLDVTTTSNNTTDRAKGNSFEFDVWDFDDND